jgi:hypothetical protein
MIFFVKKKTKEMLLKWYQYFSFYRYALWEILGDLVHFFSCLKYIHKKEQTKLRIPYEYLSGRELLHETTLYEMIHISIKSLLFIYRYRLWEILGHLVHFFSCLKCIHMKEQTKSRMPYEYLSGRELLHETTLYGLFVKYCKKHKIGPGNRLLSKECK